MSNQVKHISDSSTDKSVRSNIRQQQINKLPKDRLNRAIFLYPNEEANTPNEKLLLGIKSCDYQMIHEALNDEASVNIEIIQAGTGSIITSHTSTPLHRAVVMCDPIVIRWLLAEDADINARTKTYWKHEGLKIGMTPLELAMDFRLHHSHGGTGYCFRCEDLPNFTTFTDNANALRKHQGLEEIGPPKGCSCCIIL